MAYVETFPYSSEWVATFTEPRRKQATFVLTKAARKRFALQLIREQRFF